MKYDLNVPAIKWRVGFGDDPALAARGVTSTGAPGLVNSVIVTAFGLLFGARRDNALHARDTDTGTQVWSSRFAGDVVGSLAMYETAGRQYLLVPAASTPARGAVPALRRRSAGSCTRGRSSNARFSMLMPMTQSLASRISVAVAAACVLAVPLVALDGQPGLHDPSTVIAENGKYYVYATGNGLPMSISDDGWSWRRAGGVMQAVPGGKPGADVIARGGNNTWAPDVIKVGDKYFLYYAAPGTQPKAAVGLLIGKALDPSSPDYKWEDGGPVVWSDGVEDSNAIDPGVFRDPTNGTLWLTYGSYFGYIRLVELDPKTGKRLYPARKSLNVAINSEASIVIYRDGWYYLLVTHGSCCQGANSSYNIRMGRAKKVTGPFLDNMGIDMLQGGGKLFLGSGNRYVGPGHFGLLDLGDGVQKFSCHYEADLDRGGISVLDIRPLLWRDGWPVAGENVKPGTYEIESARTGTALELAVQGVPVGGPPAPGAAPPPPPQPIPAQEPSQVSANWPAGAAAVRMSPYMLQAQQKWAITAVTDAGGYPGSPFFKITIAGTDRALAATADGELAVLPAFTGVPEQLWRIDQLADGTYRVMPKAVPNSTAPLALSAVGSSMPTLAKFTPDSDRQRWNLRMP